MAQLPYRVDLRASAAVLRSAQAWCHERWPHTHQATWHGRINLGWNDGPGEGRWWFQRREDAMLFELTWC